MRKPPALILAALVAGPGLAVSCAESHGGSAQGQAAASVATTARCYAALTKDFRPQGRFDGITVAAPSPPVVGGRVVAPVAVCRAAWFDGVLRHDRMTTPDPADIDFGPHLVGCMLPDGTAAVFPGPDGTCKRLGLPEALPG